MLTPFSNLATFSLASRGFLRDLWVLQSFLSHLSRFSLLRRQTFHEHSTRFFYEWMNKISRKKPLTTSLTSSSPPSSTCSLLFLNGSISSCEFSFNTTAASPDLSKNSILRGATVITTLCPWPLVTVTLLSSFETRFNLGRKNDMINWPFQRYFTRMYATIP